MKPFLKKAKKIIKKNIKNYKAYQILKKVSW